jgi:1-acyl-sn-glycerol-3-phosphate acyltransferase
LRSVNHMSAHLSAGRSLIVFPEGTTSDGQAIARFKRGVFEAAIRTGADVVPVYIEVDGRSHYLSTDDAKTRARWYRDAVGRRPAFFLHLFRLSELDRLDVSIVVGVAIRSVGVSRRQLAEQARNAMMALAKK